MRLDEGKRGDQEVEAGTHRVAGGEPKTVAVLADSGERFRRKGGAVEGGKWVRRKRGARWFWGWSRGCVGCSEFARGSGDRDEGSPEE